MSKFSRAALWALSLSCLRFRTLAAPSIALGAQASLVKAMRGGVQVTKPWTSIITTTMEWSTFPWSSMRLPTVTCQTLTEVKTRPGWTTKSTNIAIPLIAAVEFLLQRRKPQTIVKLSETWRQRSLSKEKPLPLLLRRKTANSSRIRITIPWRVSSKIQAMWTPRMTSFALSHEDSMPKCLYTHLHTVAVKDWDSSLLTHSSKWWAK